MNQLDCPTPWKRRFETRDQARAEAKQALTQILWQVAVEA